MTNFIRYQDEIINLDLVASINKSFYDNKYNITFFGDSDDNKITCLRFDNEEIRDKIFDDICYTIANNLNCSLSCITEIGTIKKY